MGKIENKNAVVFWLRRHAREVETRIAQPDQTTLAKQGLSYTARMQAAADADSRADSAKVELQSLLAAVAFIEEHG